MAIESTRREFVDEVMDRSMSFVLIGPRVCVPSVKMSLGMGRSPCSNGSRLG